MQASRPIQPTEPNVRLAQRVFTDTHRVCGLPEAYKCTALAQTPPPSINGIGIANDCNFSLQLGTIPDILNS